MLDKFSEYAVTNLCHLSKKYKKFLQAIVNKQKIKHIQLQKTQKDKINHIIRIQEIW